MDKKWWTLLAVCAGMFMLLLDVTIVVVAQPAIQGGLHASLTDVQWVLDAYALTLASLLLTSGVLADRYGRKLLFQIGLVVFTLGSLLCGVARDPLMLIVSRSGQGVGGAMMSPRRWPCSGTASGAGTAGWRSASGGPSPVYRRRSARSSAA
jgi:MFS family permease